MSMQFVGISSLEGITIQNGNSSQVYIRRGLVLRNVKIKMAELREDKMKKGGKRGVKNTFAFLHRSRLVRRTGIYWVYDPPWGIGGIA